MADEIRDGPNDLDCGGGDAPASACCRPIGTINVACRVATIVNSEILVPEFSYSKDELSEVDQVVGPRDAVAASGSPPILVDIPKRTTAPHGLTGGELKRISGAMHLMKKQTRRNDALWFLSTDKGGLPRSVISEIQKRVGRYQRDADLLPYYVRVMETRRYTHAHIVLIGTSDLAARLRRASFGDLIDVRPVTDQDGLFRYLTKERTPQAGYKRIGLGGRIKGSHKLEGGGDRVALSRDLERDAIEAGLIEPWQHTNAKRSLVRKQYTPRRLKKRALRPAGQMLLFREFEKPVSRLHQFGGGTMPPAVALEVEFLRKRKRLSQRQLSALIGRSQGQFANAVRGRDPISSTSVNRLRDVLSKQVLDS